MRRILVVDDDLHACLAIKARLGGYGLAVADHGTPGVVALDNSIFDLMTLPGVIGESLGAVASHYRRRWRPAKAYDPKRQNEDV